MYSFKCLGHRNISSSHSNTLEFTKDSNIGKIAHCIVGVSSNFSLEKIKKEIKNKKEINIEIRAGKAKDIVKCLANHNFCDNNEIVIRKSDFISERTLGIRCDKASSDLDKELKEAIKVQGAEITITLL